MPSVWPLRHKAALFPLFCLVAISVIIYGVYNFQANVSSTPSGLSNLKYQTTSVRIPLGATVLNEVGDTEWPGYFVVAHLPILVEVKVLGIANVTVSGGSSYYVVSTNYVLFVNSSLKGNLATGGTIVVNQLGGIASVGQNVYVNQTYDGFPLLVIGSTYILALDSGLNMPGPDGVFLVNNNLVYSLDYVPGGSSEWHLNGVTLNQLMENWNAVASSTYSTSSASTTRYTTTTS